MDDVKRITRRSFHRAAATAMVGFKVGVGRAGATNPSSGFTLKYALASSMYGCGALEEILPEARKADASFIDLWPKPHGNQREQLDAMGEERFLELLDKNQVTLGCITQYRIGPFGLQEEIRLAARLGCRLVVTGNIRQTGLAGTALKSAVREFAERMKPHVAAAEQAGVTIALENHANSLLETPDAMKWMIEFSPSENLGVAFAPYHLPQEAKLLRELIRALGNRIVLFYAWQHGMGSKRKLPKKQELLQMPGRGPLDFAPLLRALREIDYRGFTEIFMHPFPRGVPILDPTAAVTAEINRARRYLRSCLGEAGAS